jgi:uncharacterized alpha-E superfamily protein
MSGDISDGGSGSSKSMAAQVCTIQRAKTHLLQTCDSVMTYRRRYFSTPELAAVVDLLFADASNPRSFVYQALVIRDEIDHFPGHSDYGLMPKIREEANLLVAACEQNFGTQSGRFCDLSDDLEKFSDSLTQHFFSHSVRRVY